VGDPAAPDEQPDELPHLHPAGSAASAGGALESAPSLAAYRYRVGGYLIDWFLILLVVQLALHPLRLSRGTELLVTYGVRVVYASAMLSLLDGRTLGMQVLGLRCVRSDGAGSLRLSQAIYRSVAAELIAVPSLFSLLGVLAPVADLTWPAWDPLNQTLHDKLASTLVVGPGGS
jgi:uncharacterized RDD family membrane protein YckC